MIVRPTFVTLCVSAFFGTHARTQLTKPAQSLTQVYSILDEFILAGEIQETSKREILERIRDMQAYEKASEK